MPDRHAHDLHLAVDLTDGTPITDGFVLTADGSGSADWAPAGGTIAVVAHGTMGATETFDFSAGPTHTGTLDVNLTVTLAGAVAGEEAALTLILEQDGSGGNTITWPASVVWPDGITPTLDTSAGAVEILTFLSVDGGTIWYGFHGGAASLAPATTVESETTFGIAAAVGTDTEYARQDHTHGSPANPVTEAAVQAVGHYELLMAAGSSPIEPLETGDGLDWLYVWVTP